MSELVTIGTLTGADEDSLPAPMRDAIAGMRATGADCGAVYRLVDGSARMYFSARDGMRRCDISESGSINLRMVN